MPTCPLPRHQVRQVVLIHQVALPRPTVLVRLTRVLLLVLGQNQPGAPVALAAAHYVGQFPVGAAVRGLGHTVDVAAFIVDKILLEVQPRGARGVGATRHACERGLAAFGAELAVHFARDGKTPVAAQDPGLELADT